MSVFTGVSGAWEEMLDEEVHGVGVGGSYQDVLELHVGVSGAWEQVYTLLQALALEMSGTSFVTYSDSGPATSSASVSWNSVGAGGSGFAEGDGILGGGTSPHAWLYYGSAGDYEIYFTHESGTAPSGTLNTWLSLGSPQGLSLEITRSSGLSGSDSSGGTFQIRRTSDDEVVAFETWSLSVAVSYEV